MHQAEYVSSKIGESVINKDINAKQNEKIEKVAGRSQGKMLKDRCTE